MCSGCDVSSSIRCDRAPSSRCDRVPRHASKVEAVEVIEVKRTQGGSNRDRVDGLTRADGRARGSETGREKGREEGDLDLSGGESVSLLRSSLPACLSQGKSPFDCLPQGRDCEKRFVSRLNL